MPMTIGAEVLIPKDFDKHPGARYPAIYTYGHFGGSFNFDTDPASDSEGARRAAADANVKTGYRFAQEWSGEKFPRMRSEEHTSELQSLMRNSYAVFCLKKKK